MRIKNGKKYHRTVIRILISIIIILTGIVFSLLESIVFKGIGISFIISGIVNIFLELALGDYWQSEIPIQIKSDNQDITLECTQRLGYDEYYKWVLNQNPSNLFFVGRSVLHRMDKDLLSRKLNSVSENLIRRVKEGANIRILFLNPKWELIEKIATQEGRKSVRELYSDLKKTLHVVNEIHDKLSLKCPCEGSIEIRMYEEINQYAFHSEEFSDDKNKNYAYIGLYFANKLGWQSSVLSINTERTLKTFEDHFNIIFERAEKLLSCQQNVSNSLIEFNLKLYNEATNHINDKLK
jgi:hypothetical protein